MHIYILSEIGTLQLTQLHFAVFNSDPICLFIEAHGNSFAGELLMALQLISH